MDDFFVPVAGETQTRAEHDEDVEDEAGDDEEDVASGGLFGGFFDGPAPEAGDDGRSGSGQPAALSPGGRRPAVQVHNLPEEGLGSTTSTIFRPGGAGLNHLGALRKQLHSPSPSQPSDSDAVSTTAESEDPPCYVNCVATHVVLRVASVRCTRMKEVQQAVLPPGRRGMSFFFTWMPQDCSEATAAIVRFTDQPPLAAPSRRCAEPMADLREMFEGQREGDEKIEPSAAEALWPDEAPAMVRVRIRPGEALVHVALVVGTEVVALTRLLDLRNYRSRFFSEYQLYHPDSLRQLRDAGSTAAELLSPIGSLRVALELWPFGSSLELEHSRTVRSRGFHTAEPEPEGTRTMSPQRFVCDLSDELDLLLPAREVDAAPPQCAICDNRRERPCVHCNAHGRLLCAVCHDVPVPPCARCGGTGRLYTTYAALLDTTSLRPTTCVAGGQRCTSCWGAPAACGACFGAGSLRCEDCKGVGMVPCVCTKTKH